MTICGTTAVGRKTCSHENQTMREFDCEIGVHDGDVWMRLGISPSLAIFESAEYQSP